MTLTPPSPEWFDLNSTVLALANEGQEFVESSVPEGGEPLLVTFIGPIRAWWGRRNTPEFFEYSTWRDAVRVASIHAGYLVYSPHVAWQGSWTEKAQSINDAAVISSDVIVVLTPPGTDAVGTAAEIKVAQAHGKIIVFAPPAGDTGLKVLMDRLDAIHKQINPMV